MPHDISVRMAGVDDVDAIHALLLPFAETHIILPRTRDNIFQHLQEFVVAMYDNDLIGVVAVHIYGSNLAEIRSLVVREDMHGRGIGRLLIEGCEKWATQLGVARIFALTYVPDFFAKMGYPRVRRESLPHKVWTVCVHCEKFTDCDEVAVEKRLSDAPIEPMRMPPIIEIHQA
ncbi:MAG: GNAT family N-acetyltransferase [Zetaproteobacteria bacterium CG12_big_fil_rev_8_21_14_0_65_55_1124]|nr:MAG: GNAT family N-acetyltransferase [Zetaproteobacteria bacterium CG1_02_55_237]PIS18583.1 MAG: GNAT family N-acetyltransferase [Zetaproteobacteria bacterium CG08_land_8_20_14_0_20_55_17]PIW42059.1 MAG: GNAT family N-acetyltransferase [Zetaproteobacteria bacterium CG12_big_fil_rev_8_21_14_0_65_55_1124]PIY53964.1 MAG: GNAT family N-acetyltransferase [Zetaproteobacteria bacterium CG_4_10_14_0_8_um_filter_55_43]PIZ39410.1 MAG: GNAT family N-acetyltransferase [Zetaproteobacteria bacterium CG_4_